MNNYSSTACGAHPVYTAVIDQSRKDTPLTESQQTMQDQMLQAAATGDTPTVARLIAACPVIMAGRDAQNLSALHLAAAHGHPDTIRKLLELGMDLLERNNAGIDGSGPMHYAAENGQTDTVSALLEMGAYADDKDDMGITPLDLACANAHTATAERLLQEQLNVNYSDEFGVQAINFAARNQAPVLIEALLQAGANPNVVADRDLTPIHQAALHGHDQTIRALVTGGADPNGLKVKVACCRGQQEITHLSPISLAIAGDHLNAVYALTQAGADLTKPARFKSAIRKRLKRTIHNSTERHQADRQARRNAPALADFGGIRAVLHSDCVVDDEAVTDPTTFDRMNNFGLIDEQEFRNCFGQFHHQHPLFSHAMSPLCFSVLTSRCDFIGILMKSGQYRSGQVDRLRELAESYGLFQSMAAIDYYCDFLPPKKLQVLCGRTIRGIIAKNSNNTQLNSRISKLALPPLLLDFIKDQCS